MAQSLESIYKNVLGRDIGDEGRNFYSQQVASGKSLDQIQKEIYNSDEAQQYRHRQGKTRATRQSSGEASKPGLLNATDTDAQIRNLYRSNLGRTADDQGLAYWRQQAGEKGMGFVNDAFTNTHEVRGYRSGLTSPTQPISPTQSAGDWRNSNTGAVSRDVDFGTETVEGRLESLLDPDNPLMKQAATRGKEYAASRGLLNSSIAGEAVQGEMMRQALPIASQDAQTYFKQGLTNQGYDNQFNLNDRQYLQQAEQAQLDRMFEKSMTQFKHDLATKELDQKMAGNLYGLYVDNANRMMDGFQQDYLSLITNPAIPEDQMQGKIDQLTELFERSTEASRELLLQSADWIGGWSAFPDAA